MNSLTVAVVVLCIVSSEARTTVGPESKCPNITEPPYTVNIPHETDCGRFYICQKGKKIEVACPSLLEFNARTNICDLPQKANCSSKRKTEAPISFVSRSTPSTTIGRRSECEEDKNTAHETVCNQYYRCVYGRKVLKMCPDKMVFNSEVGSCDFKYNVQCGHLVTLIATNKRDVAFDFLDDYVEITGKNKEQASEEADRDYWEDFLNENFEAMEPETPIDCPQTEDSEPTLLPHETSCNAYYRCLRGKKQLLRCPGVFQFDAKLSLCDWPMKVRCVKKKNPTTTPIPTQLCPQSSCQDSTVYLPDFANARQFIRCENGREIRETCPNGLVFDVELRVCNLEYLARTVDN